MPLNKETTHTHTHTHTYIYIYIYIVIHRQTVSFYQNSSVWLDTQDARSLDRNQSNGPRWLREFLRYLFSNSSSSRLFTFLYLIGYQSAQFFRRALHFASGSRQFHHQSAQPPWRSVYCHLQTGCFVLSERFSVAWHAGRSKTGYICIYKYTWSVLHMIFESKIGTQKLTHTYPHRGASGGVMVSKLDLQT